MTSLRIRHCPASPYVFLVAIQGNLQQFRGREMYQHGTSQLHRIPNANLSTTPQTDGHSLQLSEDVGMVTWAVWQVVSSSEAGWWRPERSWRGLCSAQEGHTDGIRCV